MAPPPRKTQTQFLITVDTETFLIDGAPPPFDANLYGTLPDGEFGVNRIMDICEKYKAKATFFVDVYMHYRYGKERVEALCQQIDRRGHDVQLHVHADWIPGCRHDSIASYPLERQASIIAEGKALIHQWTGKAPVAFRAGSYGANLDTVKALEMNGFLIDSSYFPHHWNCELSRQLNHHPANTLFRINSIVELPVTTYWLLNTPVFKKNSKLDINACSIQELRSVLPTFIRSEIRYITLFLHSFSFVKWVGKPARLAANHRALERFDTLLAAIAQWEQTAFQTMRDVAGLVERENDSQEDFIPTQNPLFIAPRLLTRLLG